MATPKRSIEPYTSVDKIVTLYKNDPSVHSDKVWGAAVLLTAGQYNTGQYVSFYGRRGGTVMQTAGDLTTIGFARAQYAAQVARKQSEGYHEINSDASIYYPLGQYVHKLQAGKTAKVTDPACQCGHSRTVHGSSGCGICQCHLTFGTAKPGSQQEAAQKAAQAPMVKQRCPCGHMRNDHAKDAGCRAQGCPCLLDPDSIKNANQGLVVACNNCGHTAFVHSLIYKMCQVASCSCARNRSQVVDAAKAPINEVVMCPCGHVATRHGSYCHAGTCQCHASQAAVVAPEREKLGLVCQCGHRAYSHNTRCRAKSCICIKTRPDAIVYAQAASVASKPQEPQASDRLQKACVDCGHPAAVHGIGCRDACSCKNLRSRVLAGKHASDWTAPEPPVPEPAPEPEPKPLPIDLVPHVRHGRELDF